MSPFVSSIKKQSRVKKSRINNEDEDEGEEEEEAGKKNT